MAEILWYKFPPIGSGELKVKTLVGYKPKLHPDTIEAMKEKLAKTTIKHDGILASFLGIDPTKEGLQLRTGLTHYSTQVGINVNWRDPRIQRHPDSLYHGGIVLSSIILTSDCHIILGNRPVDDHTIPGIIGGTANRDEIVGPLTEGIHYFNLMNSEINEELGLESENKLVALLVNQNSGRPLLLFLTHIKFNKTEVLELFQEKGNKSEHPSLYSLPTDKKSVRTFLRQHPNDSLTTLATIDALSFYLEHYDEIQKNTT